MKSFFALALIIACVTICSAFDPKANDTTPQYFDQRTDHFDAYNNGTFKHKYYLNNTFWRGSEKLSPIFFGPGGEAPCSGLIYGLGKRFAYEMGGIYVTMEHRFFGESQPFGTPEKSFERRSDALGLLTIEQSLADYVALIRDIKDQLKCPDCPVVTLGGSYPGCKSALLRYKYPSDVQMALAGSAPIFLMSTGLTEQYQFYNKIYNDSKEQVAECPAAVRTAFTALLEASADEITKAVPLCSPLPTNKEDGLDEVVFDIVQGFAGLGMGDYPPTNSPMKAACERIMDGDLDLSAWARYYNQSLTSTGCFNLTAEKSEGTPGGSVICADYSGCGGGYGGEAWDYITCTEFVEEIGTNNVTDMFPPRPFTIERQNKHCGPRFGVEIKPHHMDLEYGLSQMKAGHPSGFDHIIWSNGGKDPWSVGGVVEDVGEYNVAILMPNGAHHSDMYHGDIDNTNPHDTEDVKKARDEEVRIFKKWIEEWRQEVRSKEINI